jgi:hypothetical protein
VYSKTLGIARDRPAATRPCAIQARGADGLRATPTVLHFLFGKRWSLPTLKSIWGEEKNVISNGLAKLTCQNPKKGNPAAREGRAHAGVVRETECQAGRELAYMPIHPRILPS